MLDNDLSNKNLIPLKFLFWTVESAHAEKIGNFLDYIKPAVVSKRGFLVGLSPAGAGEL
jgi:hypothetical protein